MQPINCADPLNHLYFSQENYSANSPYGTNLNGFLNLLSIKVPSTGFGLGSTEQGQDQANGLAQCRGDVSTTNCRTCVVDAGKELGNRCPNKKGAIIWYNNSLLKYSNINFFGQIDDKNKFYTLNGQDVDDPVSFSLKVRELLNSLSNKANADPQFYATEDIELDSSSSVLDVPVSGSCNVRYELYPFVDVLTIMVSNVYVSKCVM